MQRYRTIISLSITRISDNFFWNKSEHNKFLRLLKQFGDTAL